MSEMGYSRLEFWEVWNFMSIEHGKCEFDERGIINIKGYNDSGKSAMLAALRILLCNSDPAKQVNFIQDDKNFFRVMAKFDDGVVILRDKYLNGQSLYEMYKDNKVIFSTKSPSGALTKVSDVPEPIADYLGLISYEQTCINCRTRNDKRIGVDNTGSENYKMFNAVLKSEEIARAGILLNSDKNRIVNDINAVDNELSSNKVLLSSKPDVSLEMIEWLKLHDIILDSLEESDSALDRIKNLYDSYRGIYVYNELWIVDTSQLSDLGALSSLVNSLNDIQLAPEVGQVDINGFADLQRISGLFDALSAIDLPPHIGVVDNSQFDELLNISGIIKMLGNLEVSPMIDTVDTLQIDDILLINKLNGYIESYDSMLRDYDTKLAGLSGELDSLNKSLEKFGVHLVTCPDCGRRFSPDEVHNHS